MTAFVCLARRGIDVSPLMDAIALALLAAGALGILVDRVLYVRGVARSEEEPRRGARSYGLLLVGAIGLFVWMADPVTWVGVIEVFVGVEVLILTLLLGELHGKLKLTPARTLLGSFALTIVIGTALLSLPKAGVEPLGFVSALFQATSAVCVTGLSTIDIAHDLTPLGHSILLVLIQFGGLGIMTVAFFVLTVGENELGLREHVFLRDVVASEGRSVTRVLTMIVTITLVAECMGAFALHAMRDVTVSPEGLSTEFVAVFHSVSAFCNAGFALYEGSLERAGASVVAVHAVLIVLGGLGFTVLFDLLGTANYRIARAFGRGKSDDRRSVHALTVHSKLVLVCTALLLAGGALGYFLVESRDDTAWADLPAIERAGHAAFQSVTSRTAGFDTVPQQDLSDASLALTYALMCIGASPGSTGGGVKSIVVAIALLSVVAILRRRRQVTVFGRSLPADLMLKVMAMVSLYAISLWIVTFLLIVTAGPDFAFRDVAFEAASALGTVGLSTGVTPSLPVASQLVLCLAMFVGRLGPLVFVLIWAREVRAPRVEYPAGRIHLG